MSSAKDLKLHAVRNSHSNAADHPATVFHVHSHSFHDPETAERLTTLIPVSRDRGEVKLRIGNHVLDNTVVDGLFEATADVTEEGGYNVSCMAETMVGNQGHRVEALPLDRVKEIMARLGRS